jgi:hypothetical protein
VAERGSKPGSVGNLYKAAVKLCVKEKSKLAVIRAIYHHIDSELLTLEDSGIWPNFCMLTSLVIELQVEKQVTGEINKCQRDAIHVK